MTKTQFKDYVPRTNGKRHIEEAIAELQREMDVRKRIFDNWVAAEKISWMDAHDRMERLMTALSLLIRYKMVLDSHNQAPTPDNITPLQPPSVNSLDEAPAAASA